MSNITAVKGDTEKVVLGACDIYLAEYDSENEFDLEAMVSEADNYFGNTQGGTTFEFTPSTYTVEDDKGRVRKTFQTKADATLKTGLLTFDLASLSRTLSVGTYTTNAGKKKLELPGGKATLKQKAVVAKYTDDETGEVTLIGIVATNTGALSMAYAKDKETVPELTFTAQSNGKNDVLVTILEIPASTETGGN